jgi:hypothetical protein
MESFSHYYGEVMVPPYSKITYYNLGSDPFLFLFFLKFVSYKDRKEIAKDLKSVYQADTEDIALQNLEYFNEKWSKKYPKILS